MRGAAALKCQRSAWNFVGIARLILASGLLAICIGCDPQDGDRPMPPRLTLIDTIVLEETDKNFVGEPYGLVARPGGTFLIADTRNSTIHEYSAQGKHLRRIGGRGSGPNEFARGPGRIAIDGDTLLAATDGSFARVIDLRTGKFLWSKFMPGFAVVRHARRGLVYFNYVDSERGTSLSFLQVDVDTPQYGGPFPSALGKSRIIDQALGFAEITYLGTTDTVAVGFQSSDHIFVGPFRGPFDSIYVPILSRRGSRPDLLAAITEDTSTASAIMNKQSVPWSIFALPTGEIAYIVVDVEWVTNSRYVGKMFVSVVDRKSRRVCPDASIDVSGDPLPHGAFRGDTLYVLFQDLVKGARGDGDGTISGIARYVVDSSECL
jgi:6-bladed beta-propeller protein